MFLGLNYGGLHDSSVALLSDSGEVCFAASEERFSRIKKDGRFPRLALQHIPLDQVAQVGIPYLKCREYPAAADPFFAGTLFPCSSEPSDGASFPPRWHELLGSLNKPLHFTDHHAAHALAGFFLSGLQNALVITCDGGALNCAWNMGFYSATSAGITALHTASHDHYFPLCSLYSDITAVLGFRPNLHEGKLTGLAAYAQDNLECEQAIWDIYGRLRAANQWLCEFVGGFQEQHTAALIPNPVLTDKVRQELSHFSDAEIAHSVQRITEKKLLELTRKMLSERSFDSVVLAGGIFANVKINLEIKRLGFKHIFVCPPMGDEGVALGAAIGARADSLGCGIGGQPVKNFFWGISPAEDAHSAAKALHVNVNEQPATPQQIARLLADGKIVVRVAGKMEFGPRALGHRSILCQATDPTVNDWLNKKLRRTEFMPFAPVVLAERAADLFVPSDLQGAEHTAEFMTICLACLPKFRQLCPAVVHIDGTARPQLVTATNQPDLHQILLEYEKLTGLPALINTSFNVHDEPIVGTAKDAIVAFFQSQLDYLALDDCLISLADNPTWATAATATQNILLADQKKLTTTLFRRLGERVSHLEEARAWLTQQVQNWQQEAATQQTALVQQTAWSSELQQSKEWLEKQWRMWQAAAESRQKAIDELTGQLSDLELPPANARAA